MASDEHPFPPKIILGNLMTASWISLITWWCGDWIYQWLCSNTGAAIAATPPSFVGKVLVSVQLGWPALVVAAIAGVFCVRISERGLHPVVAATYMLGRFDPTTAICVGCVLLVMNSNSTGD